MRYLTDLTAVGIEPLYAVLASAIGVNGNRLSFVRCAPTWCDDLSEPRDRDQYHFGEVILEAIPPDIEGYARILRPILDQAANIGGRATSPVFDVQGRYIRPCLDKPPVSASAGSTEARERIARRYRRPLRRPVKPTDRDVQRIGFEKHFGPPCFEEVSHWWHTRIARNAPRQRLALP